MLWLFADGMHVQTPVPNQIDGELRVLLCLTQLHSQSMSGSFMYNT